jgi:hypothetical protein
MIFELETLTEIFANKTSPKLLCKRSWFDKYQKGEIWQVIDGRLWKIFPRIELTILNGYSAKWQVIEEKSLEEQIEELLG